MRLLDNIENPINQSTAEALMSRKRGGHFPSFLIFSGPRESTDKVALALSQALVCEVSSEACGSCGACMRMAKMQSESLLRLEPENSMIKIEQARKILDFLSFRALGAWRIVIIADAHTLNTQAANSLLKIFEEPPSRTSFFLLTSHLDSLLPTIRSRALCFRFPADSIQIEETGEADSEVSEIWQNLISHQGETYPSETLAALRDFCEDRKQSLFALRVLQRLALTRAKENVNEKSKMKYWLNLTESAVRAESDIHGNVDRTLLFENLWLKDLLQKSL